MKNTKINILSIASIICLYSCTPKPVATIDIEKIKTEALQNTANHVIQDGYNDMQLHADKLLQLAISFNANNATTTLDSAKAEWKAIRSSWEKSEAWLFGPVATDNIDPRIDTWPVDFNSMDSLLNSTAVLNANYINQLDDALKGFHPIEYMLWGKNGNKVNTDFTNRQKQYLVSLATNLNTLCLELKTNWQNNFALQLANAGNGSTEFVSKKLAFVQLCDAMAGICAEVADGKINEPFVAQNALLEESPFAQNSLVDFTNNINGVMQLYQGNFTTDGKGLEDVVKFYNTSLDAEIKAKHHNAIVALQSITVPFGIAIISQPIAVQNAITKITELQEVLDSKLKTFILTQIQ